MSVRVRFILVLVALCVASPEVRAQALSGTWHEGPEVVHVVVADWGVACGPRPVDRFVPGRDVTIRDNGSNLTFQGRRTDTTTGCWSDNRTVVVQSATHPSAQRWVVTCSTPPSEPLGERGTYTLDVASPTHMHFRADTAYVWTIEGSHCRATAVLTRDYDRVAAPTVPPATPPPAPPPPPVQPAPVSRCAHPGTAVTVSVLPGHRRVPTGGRACFRARVLDAARCEVPGQEVTWSARPPAGAPEGVMAGGCLVVPPGVVSGTYVVTAAAGGLHGESSVTLVTADAYRSLVAAHLEDPDGGTELPAVGESSGAQFGTSSVSVSSTSRRGMAWPWVLAAGAGVLTVLAGFMALRRRGSSARASGYDGWSPSRPPGSLSNGPGMSLPGSSRGVAPGEEGSGPAVPTLVLPVPGGAPVAIVAEGPPAVPNVPPPGRRCPTCGAQYGAEMAFCPIDGTAFAGAEPLTAPSPPSQHPTPAMDAPTGGVCPKCQRRFAPPTQFCVEDGMPLRPIGEK